MPTFPTEVFRFFDLPVTTVKPPQRRIFDVNTLIHSAVPSDCHDINKPFDAIYQNMK